MTLQKLASLLAKREGKKTQARIGEIRELLKLLADYAHETTYRFNAPSGDPMISNSVHDWLEAELDKRFAKESRKKKA